MSDRDTLVAALNSRFIRMVTERSTDALLSDDAQREAAALAAAIDPGSDLQAAQVLGTFHWQRYLARRNPSELATATEFYASVYRASPNAVPEPVRRDLARLADDDVQQESELISQYNRAAESVNSSLQRGEPLAPRQIDALREVLTLVAPDHPLRVAVLSSLGFALRIVAEGNGDIVQLTEAAELGRTAVGLTPPDHAAYVPRLTNLGGTLQAVFDHSGDAAVLDEMVATFRAVVDATPDTADDYGLLLSMLGDALQKSSARGGAAAALGELVDTRRAAVRATPAGDTRYVVVLEALAGALQMLADTNGDAEALVEVVEVRRAAVQAVNADDSNYVAVLSNLASTLQKLAARTGDTDSLSEAVEVHRAAVEAASIGHDEYGAVLYNLGNALEKSMDATQKPEILVELVETRRASASATPPGHANYGAVLQSLGDALREFAKQAGAAEALHEAVQVLRTAVGTHTDSPSEYGARLAGLGDALSDVAFSTGEPAARADAIDAFRAALEATPTGDPRRTERLANFGRLLTLQYVSTGDDSTLRETAGVLRVLVRATPAGDPDLAGRLINLSITLQRLFTRTGEAAVLEEAVWAGRAADDAAADGQPERGAALTNLCDVLRMRYDRTGDGLSLIVGIEAGRKAVNALPDGSQRRGSALVSLGIALQDLYRRNGNTDTLLEAIAVHRAALQTPMDARHETAGLLNLGNALKARYESDGVIESLAEAIALYRRAKQRDLRPDGIVMNNLGIALEAMYERTGDTAVLKEARQSYREAAEGPGVTTDLRIGAYRQLALLADRDAEGALQALADIETAVSLVPELIPVALTQSDRESRLGRLRSLPEVAAEAALTVGDGERAVQLLEQTRGVLVAATVDARSNDPAWLRRADPDLARALKALRADLRSDHAAGSPEFQAAQNRWTEVMSRIRAVDEFARSAAAPSIADLADHVGEGHFVFVVAGPTRSDAIVVSGLLDGHCRVIPLPFTQEEARRQANLLMSARRTAVDYGAGPQAKMDAQATILDVLAWLWDSITGPVLSALGHHVTPVSEEAWPRIWWCPVGLVNYLPLHAAGHHADLRSADPGTREHPRTALDRVVSSYAPTMRALVHARSQEPSVKAGALIISVPDAPDVPLLSGAAAQADAVAALIPAARRPPRPTREEISGILASYPIVHFACHGVVDMKNPANSRLVLYDHRTDPLTVSDISKLNLTGSLAYLCACDTSVSPANLADESIHITGAFHLAGYQNVIGTLWPVGDRTGGELARYFYSRLTRGGTVPPDTRQAAHALHWATRQLRGRSHAAPTVWAAYTHTGI
ncbi:CHAT domain-containing protein [Catenulispora rubra]|uniref:CHAT domain-containing protein n=1 Tax=Catenulispora rubra TaxID=280293 RepID=UPI0018926857|nr:CHAT domain-containing protein [Catenulispora rubra]